MTGYAAADLERWVAEPAKAAPSPRSPFARDRARVLHAAALRRLAGKTQVVTVGEGDAPRTRLTHSLECAQIGREIADSLGADPDLVDAACLAHDLGHPPFGHNGETVLDEIAQPAGGFEGNAQSLRLLTRLEFKIPGAGLNLTRATLDAATKYPWPRPEGGGKFGVYTDDLPVFDWLRRDAPDAGRCLEAQVMDWADDVAYSVHDVEDGILAGSVDVRGVDPGAVAQTAQQTYLPGADLRALEQTLGMLMTQPWWVRAFDGGPAAVGALKAMTSELIGRFSSAAVGATRRAHGDGRLRRYAADLVVPDQTRVECAVLKAVAVRYVMVRRAPEQERQRRLVRELVAALLERGDAGLGPLLRPAWRRAPDDVARLRVVVDEVAGLTDAGALAAHTRLVGS